MGITQMDMYWLLRLDSISAGLITLFVIGAILSIIGFSYAAVTHSDLYLYKGEEEKRELKKYHKAMGRSFKMLAISIILFIAFILTPSTKDMVKIKIFPHLATAKNIKEVKKIPARLIKVLGISIEKLEKIVKQEDKK